METPQPLDQCPPDISDDDIYKAMEQIRGFIDITPAAFKEIYAVAYRVAIGRIQDSVRADQIMSRPAIFIRVDTPLLEAAQVMAAHDISGVPVVDDAQRVAGVLSEKDFLRQMGGQQHLSLMALIAECLQREGCLALSLRNRPAAQIMSAPPITVKPRTTLAEIADLFSRKSINRTPVVDDQVKCQESTRWKSCTKCGASPRAPRLWGWRKSSGPGWGPSAVSCP
jgi:CBS domain-containing membrane protein